MTSALGGDMNADLDETARENLDEASGVSRLRQEADADQVLLQACAPGRCS
ncbi:hypothetical protein P7L87_25680 [Vibrio parahaemolyticus]|nr:hypothetical protein [Vibrio parahaemolyticus]